MVYAIFTFIALGIAGGYFFLGLEHKDLLDEILMSALYFMAFVAGIEIGGNRHIIKKNLQSAEYSAGSCHSNGCNYRQFRRCGSFSLRDRDGNAGRAACRQCFRLVQPFLCSYQYAV